mmetsp:Transcript_47602/g.112024  ORF Transcript_47602/g.112024 Transcript_47602/m.112024 type:complete len:291 (+) Transcript_47602:159-1031(+)
MTPLHFAAERRVGVQGDARSKAERLAASRRIATLLVDHGYDVNVKDKSGATPLSIVADASIREILTKRRGAAAASAPRRVRVLCLHAYGSTPQDFSIRLSPLTKLVNKLGAREFEVDWVFLPGPHSHVGDGQVWWHYPGWDHVEDPQGFLRARRYTGCEDFLRAVDSETQRGHFDGVIGFSQGAVAAAVLIGQRPNSLSWAVFFSGFPPRDPDLALPPEPLQLPTLHIWGIQDQIVPATDSEALAMLFADSRTVAHNKGHIVNLQAADRRAVAEFIVNRIRSPVTEVGGH